MQPLERFQGLLRELFQFDCQDLDFGIYRVLNYKRKQIEEFITTRLPQHVDEAFILCSFSTSQTPFPSELCDYGPQLINLKP